MGEGLQLPSASAGQAEGDVRWRIAVACHSNPCPIPSHRYNADMGLAATNGNKFKMAEDAVHVLHYTLGPFKPWDYWTPYLITPSVIWVAFR